jgi:hypothetical protein
MPTATGHRAALHEAPPAVRLLTPRQRAYQQVRLQSPLDVTSVTGHSVGARRAAICRGSSGDPARWTGRTSMPLAASIWFSFLPTIHQLMSKKIYLRRIEHAIHVLDTIKLNLVLGTCLG